MVVAVAATSAAAAAVEVGSRGGRCRPPSCHLHHRLRDAPLRGRGGGGGEARHGRGGGGGRPPLQVHVGRVPLMGAGGADGGGLNACESGGTYLKEVDKWGGRGGVRGIRARGAVQMRKEEGPAAAGGGQRPGTNPPSGGRVPRAAAPTLALGTTRRAARTHAGTRARPTSPKLHYRRGRRRGRPRSNPRRQRGRPRGGGCRARRRRR